MRQPAIHQRRPRAGTARVPTSQILDLGTLLPILISPILLPCKGKTSTTSSASRTICQQSHNWPRHPNIPAENAHACDGDMDAQIRGHRCESHTGAEDTRRPRRTIPSRR